MFFRFASRVRSYGSKIASALRKRLAKTAETCASQSTFVAERLKFYYSVPAGYVAVTLCSVALSLSVLMLLSFPMWLAFALLGCTIAHELGHYVSASYMGYKPKTPFFVPAFGWIWSGTHVPGVDNNPSHVAVIATSGPLVGLGFAALVGLAGITAAFVPLAWAGFWLSMFQLYSITLGSDGRRYRRAIKELEDNGETLATVTELRAAIAAR